MVLMPEKYEMIMEVCGVGRVPIVIFYFGYVFEKYPFKASNFLNKVRIQSGEVTVPRSLGHQQ